MLKLMTAVLGLQWLADGDRVYHPRAVLFIDLCYTCTVGLVTGFISAATRVTLGWVWAAVRCIRFDEPLLPGAAGILDSGWLMHGAMMKCRYAAGTAPATKR